MALKSTFLAPKVSLGWAISSLNMPTLAAFLRSVAWVNKLDFHAFTFSFVGDECLELSKAPSMQSTALSLPPKGSAANIREVFKNQCCTGLNRLNQALREYMVTIFSETFLSTRDFLQVSLGRLQLQTALNDQVYRSIV